MVIHLFHTYLTPDLGCYPFTTLEKSALRSCQVNQYLKTICAEKERAQMYLYDLLYE